MGWEGGGALPTVSTANGDRRCTRPEGGEGVSYRAEHLLNSTAQRPAGNPSLIHLPQRNENMSTYRTWV